MQFNLQTTIMCSPTTTSTVPPKITLVKTTTTSTSNMSAPGDCQFTGPISLEKVFPVYEEMKNMNFSYCDGMSCSRADTASTTPSSISGSSPDIFAEGAMNEYNESWPSQEQQYARLYEESQAIPYQVEQLALLHRPQPRKLSNPSQIPTLEPTVIAVPFLVNYNDILNYGKQCLPTVLEFDHEEDSCSSLDDDDDQRLPTVLEFHDDDNEDDCCSSIGDDGDDERSWTTSQSEQDESEPDYPLEPVSYRYYFFDCYQDHRWDLARGDKVLSEAMYYHVLQAAALTPSPELAPIPVPVESPTFSHLVKPQALRVVCPTTIAPLHRPDDDDQEEESDFTKDCSNWYQSFCQSSPESSLQTGQRVWLP
jgi:hypothetical protein